MNIQDIIAALQEKRIRITDHADEESQADNLTFDEIFLSVLQGEIIEDYPADKPYPSCLIYEITFKVKRSTAFGRTIQKQNGQC